MTLLALPPGATLALAAPASLLARGAASVASVAIALPGDFLANATPVAVSMPTAGAVPGLILPPLAASGSELPTGEAIGVAPADATIAGADSTLMLDQPVYAATGAAGAELPARPVAGSAPPPIITLRRLTEPRPRPGRLDPPEPGPAPRTDVAFGQQDDVAAKPDASGMTPDAPALPPPASTPVMLAEQPASVAANDQPVPPDDGPIALPSPGTAFASVAGSATAPAAAISVQTAAPGAPAALVGLAERQASVPNARSIDIGDRSARTVEVAPARASTPVPTGTPFEPAAIPTDGIVALPAGPAPTELSDMRPMAHQRGEWSQPVPREPFVTAVPATAIVVPGVAPGRQGVQTAAKAQSVAVAETETTPSPTGAQARARGGLHIDAATPAPLPLAPSPIVPAFRAFANAMFKAAGADSRATMEVSGMAAPAPLPGVLSPTIVATNAAEPVDLTQPHWPAAMAERIEILRDRADAGDTRVRLVPDVLGSIDVAVRQVGDVVHIHFTAAEAQTRAILLEAGPQLARAAADRGMTLGETSVGGGQHDAPGQRTPQGAPMSPRPDRTANADPTHPDTRIA